MRSVGRQLPVAIPHISLSFSFFLADGYEEKWLTQLVKHVLFEEISAWTTSIGYFSQLNKKILYVAVEPQEEFALLYKKISLLLRPGIFFDTTVFERGMLPSYVPHISLDYDFDGDAYTFASLQSEKIEAFFDVSRLSVMRIQQNSIEIIS